MKSEEYMAMRIPVLPNRQIMEFGGPEAIFLPRGLEVLQWPWLPACFFRKSGVGDPTFGRDTCDLHPVFVAVSGAPPAGERHGTPI